MLLLPLSIPIFFFHDTATTEIYTLSLHDALPISVVTENGRKIAVLEESTEENGRPGGTTVEKADLDGLKLLSIKITRSEEHTSELQSRLHLVCRLLLEKKKKK